MDKKINESLRFFASIGKMILDEGGKIESAKDIINRIWSEDFEENFEIDIHITYLNDLLEGFDMLMKAEKYELAVVIACTTFEHSINEFYYDFLCRKLDYGSAKIKKIIEKINFVDKFDWFFSLSTNCKFDDKIYAYIVNLNKIRNKFVHYKPEEDGFINKYIIKDLKKFKFTMSKARQFLLNVELDNNPALKNAYDIVLPWFEDFDINEAIRKTYAKKT